MRFHITSWPESLTCPPLIGTGAPSSRSILKLHGASGGTGRDRCHQDTDCPNTDGFTDEVDVIEATVVTTCDNAVMCFPHCWCRRCRQR